MTSWRAARPLVIISEIVHSRVRPTEIRSSLSVISTVQGAVRGHRYFFIRAPSPHLRFPPRERDAAVRSGATFRGDSAAATPVPTPFVASKGGGLV